MSAQRAAVGPDRSDAGQGGLREALRLRSERARCGSSRTAWRVLRGVTSIFFGRCAPCLSKFRSFGPIESTCRSNRLQ